MAKRRVRFSFTPETITEPIIYSLGQQFNVVTNILQAHLAEDMGWITLELDGEEANIDAGISWATSLGVRSELISHEATEV